MSTTKARVCTLHPQTRATFDPSELAIVLSHYDLGVVESVTEFTKGSRRSPKVGIVTSKGKFLLKRRSAERANPQRVRFSHQLQAHLSRSGFPLSKLIPTLQQSDTMLVLKKHVYEMFEFVPGHDFEKNVAQAQDTGFTLAKFHRATSQYTPTTSYNIPRGDYHDAPGVRTGLCAIGSTLKSHDSFTGDDFELAELVQHLLEKYDLAAEQVNQQGLTSWLEQISHSDWHPGNVLFRKDKVLAVIDYDSARYSYRITDVANGVLQFSIIASGDPASWPEHLDEERFRSFLDGYKLIAPLSEGEKKCIIPLMTEALIAECVSPIAATGSVGRWTGFRVLKMVRRKLDWLEQHADRLLQESNS